MKSEMTVSQMCFEMCLCVCCHSLGTLKLLDEEEGREDEDESDVEADEDRLEPRSDDEDT